MWTIWFIYYMHINQLYSVYSNLGVYTGKLDASFAVNRMEAGLHSFVSKKHVNISRLLGVWKTEYVMFPGKPVRLDWDGTHIANDSQY